MGIPGLRPILDNLKKTPFHPQWFSFLREDRDLRATCAALSGTVLDVGCADAKPQRYLGGETRYVGLDYFDTASNWYRTRPSVFGDAQQLPLADDVVDHALLLDVLEHIPDPDRCLVEIHRVLKPGGTLTIQVPFMYPVHDAPLDFHRWTRFGLHRAADRSGFEISNETSIGHPIETAALGANIAMSKTVLNWVSSRNLLLILGAVLPLAVLLVNCLAWVTVSLSRTEDMMPHAYRMVWRKS